MTTVANHSPAGKADRVRPDGHQHPEQLSASPDVTRRRRTSDDDADVLRAGPTVVEVRHQFLTGAWPTTSDLELLRCRHAADPQLSARPLVDVLPHPLIGAAAGRAR